MNSNNNHNSKDLRNEKEFDALQESGAHIARARFDSIPDAGEFRGRLKAQLLEKRELKRSSMSQKFAKLLSHFVPTQKTFAVGFVVLLLIAVVTTTLLNSPGVGPGSNSLATLFIDRAYAKDNFEVIPTSTDGLAVDSNTEFIIKSKTALSRDALLPHLHISPEVAFELTQITDHEFRLSPKSELKEKQVYSVKIDAAYNDEQNITVERDFSFAFQVKNQFKLLSSIPADRAIGVPTNTGIELTFSSENYSDYEKNFSIEPKAEGKFEVHGRTLVFVPKELKPATIYTVTLKKDIVVKGTDPMKEDVTFRFETVSKVSREQNFWYMNTTKVEFAPAGPMLFSVAGSGDSQEFIVKASAFKSFDLYQKNFLKSLEIPGWAYETQKNFIVSKSDISEARTFTLQAQIYKNDYNKYLVLPENLPKGDYWIEITSLGQTQHLFAEVTDLATYLTVAADKTLVWVNDLSTKAPVENAKIILKDANTLAKTNTDGVATFDTEKLNIVSRERSASRYIQEAPMFLEVNRGEESTLLNFSVAADTLQYVKPVIDSYIVNFATDRSLYLPSDTIKFWGFIATKDKSPIPGTLTIGIPNNNNYYYGRNLGDLGFLQSVDVTPDAQGYFRGEIKLSNLTANGYTLLLKQGNDILSNRYMEVSQYVKPTMTLSLTADKKAVFAGDKVNFTGSVKLFEGTPVPNYEMSYSSQSGGSAFGDLKTDANGNIHFTATAENSSACDIMSNDYCSLYQGMYQSISVNPKNPEESPVVGYGGYLMYEANIAGVSNFEIKNKNTANVSTTWYNLDLAPLNDDDFSNDDTVFSTHAALKHVEGIVFETHYEKVESGQYYDFITKTTEKTYNYNSVTTATARISGETDKQGHFATDITTLPDRSYELRLVMTDAQGRRAFVIQNLYSNPSYDINNNMDWYSLRNAQEKTKPDTVSYGYKIGDSVKLQFYKNDKPLENTSGNFLFTQYQDGLRKFDVQKSSTYEFVFAEQDVPNIYVGVMYFDGTRYVQTAEGDYRNFINFDTRDRALKVAVTSDKSDYKPGDEVTLKIKTTDVNGKGHAAKINISVIDEAYLALTGYTNGMHSYAAADPIASLYQSVRDGVLLTQKSHRAADIGMFGGAEGGGCFLAGTPILLSDGTAKNIEDIAVGDIVATLKSETDNTRVRGQVLKVQNHIVSEYRIVNDTLRVTPEHRVLLNGQWKTAGDIRVGDMLRGQDGQPVQVFSVEIKHDLVKVYNFAVENYHTYIAGGIYVHNDKGGGAARSQFPDIALYQFVDTDGSGNGKVTFKLPDSVTGWRVTAEAMSTDLYAGIGDKTLNVSLPAFGLLFVPQNMLFGDKPMLSAAVYGSGLQEKSTANVSFSTDLLSKVFSKTIPAFTRVSVPTDKPVTQSGKVRLDVSTSAGKDALEKSFTAVNSRVVESAQTLIPLQNGSLDLAAAKSASAPVQLTFVDAGVGSLYSRMSNLSWDGGTRLDQKAGTIVSHIWFKDFFTPEELSVPQNLSSYIAEGFKLLPYGTSDLALSAKVAAVLRESNSFDQERMGMYFTGKLYDTNATSEELAQALWGAAALGEPVLASIHTLAQNEKIQAQDKIYLALAATELGDHEYARTLYSDIATHVKETKTTAKVVFAEEGKNEILENSALLSVLAVRLQEPLADKLDKFVQDEPKEIVLNLESLLFVKEKVATLPKGKGTVTLSVGDQKIPVSVENGAAQMITVVPANFNSLQISNLNGPIALLVTYDRPAQTENTSKRVKLTREYFVDGKKVDAIKAGDIVQVHLTPVFGKDAPAGLYLIEDSLPSGLKLTSGVETINPWYGSSCPGFMPYEVDSGRVKFMIDKTSLDFAKNSSPDGYIPYGCNNKPYLSYYARVSTLGEFRREGALIQSMESTDVKNFSTDVGTLQITE